MPTKNPNVSKPKRRGAMPKNVKQQIVSRYPKSQVVHGGFGKSSYPALEKLGIDAFGQDGDALRLPPEIRDPRFQQDNYFIPQTDVVSGDPNTILNYWFDYYYRFHPLVGNLIDLHSTLPLSRFGLTGITDSKILQAYEEMCEDMQLFERMVDTLKLYFLRGEAMPFLWWNDEINRFADITMLDTNYIYVIGHYLLYSPKGDVTRRYELKPDEYIRGLVNSNNDTDRQLVNEFLDEKIVAAIASNMNLELDPFATEMLIKAANPWHIRGSSICEGIVKDLLYEDKLRKAQEAIATGHITPIRLWKIGDQNNIALPEDLSAFREVLFEANNDPQINLVTHHAVNLNVEGSTGKLLPLAPEFLHVEGRVLTRLFSNKSMTDGSGPTYANASVSLRILMARYIPIRTMLENFFYRKAFLPVAIANGYLKITTAELSHRVRSDNKNREPLTPIFDWRHKQSLIDDSNIKSMLLQLQSKTMLSMKTICETLNVDYDTEKQRLKDEQGGVFDMAMVKARTDEIAAIGKSGGKQRFKMFFKAIFDWARLLAGTASEREELFNEQQPEDGEEKQPGGPVGMDGGEMGGMMDDMGEGSVEETSDAGETAEKKRKNIPKTFTSQQYKDAVRQVDKIYRTSGKKIVEFFKRREEQSEDSKVKRYNVQGQLFKAAAQRSPDPWYKELGTLPSIDLNSKRILMTLDSNLKTLLVREGRVFTGEVGRKYSEENNFEIPAGEVSAEFERRLASVSKDITSDTIVPLTAAMREIISNNYDSAAVIIDTLNTSEKIALKTTAGKISQENNKIINNLVEGAFKSARSRYYEYLKDVDDSSNIVTALIDSDTEMSKEKLYGGLYGIWEEVQKAFLQSVRSGAIEVLENTDKRFSESIKEINRTSEQTLKEKNEQTSKKNS